MSSAPPVACVVDAGVVAKLFIGEPETEAAERLFATSAGDKAGALHVPELLFIEVANVLWKRVQRGDVQESAALKASEMLGKLPLVSTPLSVIFDDALRVALRNKVTAYDAAYVALALRLGLPFVTADERLARKLGNERVSVLMLQEL